MAQATPSGRSAAATPSSATTHQPASQRFAASARRTTRGPKRGTKTAARYARPPARTLSSSRQSSFHAIRRSSRSSVATGSSTSTTSTSSVRDVGERDETGDPRRVRRQHAARAGRDGDRVTRVPALAGGRKHDQGVRRRSSIELDQGLPWRRPAEQGALHLAGEERVQRALAGDGRAGAGHGEADRPGPGVPLERERLDDPDGGGDGRGDHDERDEDGCEAARHGRSLAQWQRSCGPEGDAFRDLPRRRRGSAAGFRESGILLREQAAAPRLT